MLPDALPLAGDDEVFLREAIAEAHLAELSGEVPVGAVIVRDGVVLARGRNRVITDSDPTAHAEIIAMREAGRLIGNYRLENCELYATLEPCAMCAGAILHARIRRLVYAAPDPKAGACGSVLEVMNHPKLNHRVEVTAGVLADECGAMLTNFFRARRTKPAEVASNGGE
jgi:tRNA(adenine34) deaminase